MKQTIKKPLKFTMALLPLMIVGSFFTGIYSFSTYAPDMQNEMIAKIGSYELLLLVGTVQSVLYASVAGFLGYILSEKTGLMRSLRFDKKKFTKSTLITVVSGILFSLDYWTFGKILPTGNIGCYCTIGSMYFSHLHFADKKCYGYEADYKNRHCGKRMYCVSNGSDYFRYIGPGEL